MERNVPEQAGAEQLLPKLTGVCKKLQRVRVDGGYRQGLQQWVPAIPLKSVMVAEFLVAGFVSKGGFGSR